MNHRPSQNNETSNWIASRKDDNFFYSKGAKIIYPLNCNNSLVITDKESGDVLATKDYATIQTGSNLQKIPISQMEKILYHSSRIFPSQSIVYQKPISITKKEQLPELGSNELHSKLQEEYGLFLEKISNIDACKGKNRIYKITTSNKEEFILKYGGINNDLLNGQLKVVRNVSLFPSILTTKKGNSLISINGNNYSLENFIDGTPFIGDEEKYFSELGAKMGDLHNKINSFSKGNSTLETLLKNGGNFLSESNILSGYIDSFNWMGEHHDLTKEYLKLIQDGFCEELNLAPKQIIHGDLNRTNLIWNKDSAKIIDFETMKKSQRTMEFVSPLIFRGNFQTPIYKKDSLSQLMTSYNLAAEDKLTSKETSLLPDLIKSYLLRLHTIRTIRRNEKDESFEKQLRLNFEKLEDEK